MSDGVVGSRGCGPLAALHAAIDGLLAEDPGVLAEGESVLGLLAAVSRLERVASAQAVAFDASPEWVDEGAQRSPCWVAIRRRCPLRDARRCLRLGAVVGEMPLVEAAWSAGELGAAHVEVLAAARRPALVEAFGRDEQLLVGFATDLSFAKFQRAVAYWVQVNAPDDAEEAAADQREQRSVQLSQSFEGMWFGDATLDPISGEIVHNELGRLEQELFRAEWAETKRAMGREPSLADLPRTAAQRRADALVEMAIRSRTAPADGQRPAPLLTVLIDYPTFAGRVCELASRTVVTPGSLVHWLDDAYVERVVFDGKGALLDVGPRQRLFRYRKRRGIQVRDGECTHELCEEPGEVCEVDHIEPYAQGGDTVPGNGRLLCGFHNRRRQTHPWLPWDDTDDTDEDEAHEDGADELDEAADAEVDDADDDDVHEPEADGLVETDPVFTSDSGECDWNEEETTTNEEP